MAGKPGRIFSQELKEAAVLRIVVGGERVSVDLGSVEEEAPEIT